MAMTDKAFEQYQTKRSAILDVLGNMTDEELTMIWEDIEEEFFDVSILTGGKK